MAALDWFPGDLTDAERDAGFDHRDIANPDAHYVGQPPTLRAVVHILSASRRIVKLRLSDNRVGYQLQRLGRYSFPGANQGPDWLPDLNFSILDPAFAVQYFQSAITEARGMKSRIIEVAEA
jgi:hypothetical protein